jgi:hypothetical protein
MFVEGSDHHLWPFPILIYLANFGKDDFKSVVCRGDFGEDVFKFAVFLGYLGSLAMLATPMQ